MVRSQQRNPYAAPATGKSEPDERRPLAQAAQEAFRGWEFLRLVFNGFLTVWCLAVSALGYGPSLLEPSFWQITLNGAIIANVCFFAGPIAELLMRAIGYRASGVRVVLFVAGTGLTWILAMAQLGFMQAIP